ncbi:MAG: preprotein translocase subunit SecY [Streptosporangiales bacterium]|nr:preprotein translocase subunit SecY [Streptosporangiales bacterium]
MCRAGGSVQLSAFGRAFKTPDLRKKLLFVLFIVVVFRLGSIVPTPGVSYGAITRCAEAATGGDDSSVYGMLNLFSGGALLRLSIFALGIMPYITASIIIQLLTVVIPRFEELKKEGPSGSTKLTQYTRYLTVALGVLEGTGYIAMARYGQLFPNQPGCTGDDIIPDQGIFTIIVMVFTMTAGVAVIMWLGELITERGIGNGMSILIFCQIIAVFPSQLGAIYSQDKLKFAAVMALGLLLVAAVVFVEQAQRRIPLQYAKRMVGRRMYGGSSTYIPLKVNQAGVIPVIFASSLLYLPQLASLIWQENKAFSTFVNQYLVKGDHPLYMGIYVLLVIFFAFFYVSITFNPLEVADNMKKNGGFVPGIRPGRPTAEYLDYVLTRITTPGSLYLATVALIPLIAISLVQATQQFPFGGTSLLIMVGVGLDTVKQIESNLQQRNYAGFLR